jgi:predicted transcriptional regulator
MARKGPDPNAAERRAKALELRKQGMSYREIGRALGVSRTAAHKYVTKELDAIRAETRASAEQLREIELERLDRYLAALEPKIVEGDDKAIATALRVMERRAKLTGLDAPQRSEVTVGGADVVDRLRAMLGGSDDG